MGNTSSTQNTTHLVGDSSPTPTIGPRTSCGYLDDVSMAFDAGSAALKAELDTALANLQSNPSQPQYLADYQSKLQEYTLYRNAQTTTVKALKDIAAAIIQNFR